MKKRTSNFAAGLLIVGALFSAGTASAETITKTGTQNFKYNTDSTKPFSIGSQRVNGGFEVSSRAELNHQDASSNTKRYSIRKSIASANLFGRVGKHKLVLLSADTSAYNYRQSEVFRSTMNARGTIYVMGSRIVSSTITQGGREASVTWGRSATGIPLVKGGGSVSVPIPYLGIPVDFEGKYLGTGKYAVNSKASSVDAWSSDGIMGTNSSANISAGATAKVSGSVSVLGFGVGGAVTLADGTIGPRTSTGTTICNPFHKVARSYGCTSFPNVFHNQSTNATLSMDFLAGKVFIKTPVTDVTVASWGAPYSFTVGPRAYNTVKLNGTY